jgi:hypothetical protein
MRRNAVGSLFALRTQTKTRRERRVLCYSRRIAIIAHMPDTAFTSVANAKKFLYHVNILNKRLILRM